MALTKKDQETKSSSRTRVWGHCALATWGALIPWAAVPCDDTDSDGQSPSAPATASSRAERWGGSAGPGPGAVSAALGWACRPLCLGGELWGPSGARTLLGERKLTPGSQSSYRSTAGPRVTFSWGECCLGGWGRGDLNGMGGLVG